MRASEEQIALFDRYLTGEMSAAERTYFEQSLSADPELVMAFNEYVAMAQALDEAGRMGLKNRFKTIAASVPDTEIQDYNPGSGRNTTRKDRYWNVMSWVMIIGSVILLIAFIVAIMNLPDLEKKLNGGSVPVIEKEVEQICGLYEVKPLLLLESADERLEDVEIDSTGERYNTEITTRKLMICQSEDETVSMRLVLNQLQDTIVINGLLCEPTVYLKSNNPVSYVVSCGDNLFILSKKGFEPYTKSACTDTVAMADGQVLPEDVAEIKSTTQNGNQSIETEDAAVEYSVIAIHDTSFVYSTTIRGTGKKAEKKVNEAPKEYTVMKGAVSYRVSGVTTEPRFKGDLDQWLKQNVVYPDDMVRIGKTGIASVKFFLDQKGQIWEPKIEQSLSPSCDKAILDAVKKMPNWNPGYENNQPTGMNVTMSIRFVKMP